MPIYTFECSKCGKIIEKLVPMGTDSIKCECGADTKKIPSLSNFQLLGGGWYKDGYVKPPGKG